MSRTMRHQVKTTMKERLSNLDEFYVRDGRGNIVERWAKISEKPAREDGYSYATYTVRGYYDSERL